MTWFCSYFTYLYLAISLPESMHYLKVKSIKLHYPNFILVIIHLNVPPWNHTDPRKLETCSFDVIGFQQCPSKSAFFTAYKCFLEPAEYGM
jgi:hypothetical protein